jgi:hypothetical protein
MYEVSKEIWFSGVGATIIGFILGGLFSYFPQLFNRKSRIRSYKASLAAEIKKCNEMATGYAAEGAVKSPSYRLPVFAWNNAYPQLLAVGVLNECQVEFLNQFYIEVDSLNRGLDQANDARFTNGGGSLLTEEHKRNKLKASNIMSNFSKALDAIQSTKELCWL